MGKILHCFATGIARQAVFSYGVGENLILRCASSSGLSTRSDAQAAAIKKKWWVSVDQ